MSKSSQKSDLLHSIPCEFVGKYVLALKLSAKVMNGADSAKLMNIINNQIAGCYLFQCGLCRSFLVTLRA